TIKGCDGNCVSKDEVLPPPPARPKKIDEAMHPDDFAYLKSKPEDKSKVFEKKIMSGDEIKSSDTIRQDRLWDEILSNVQNSPSRDFNSKLNWKTLFDYLK